MKKTIAFIILFALLLSPISCKSEPNAYKMLSEFVSAYGADGIIYSPTIEEGNDGYIRAGLVESIYLFSGNFPENYAILLNARTDLSSECGLFVCTDAEMLGAVEEMCIERIKLICQGDSRAFIKQSGEILFYSTMQDRERAEKIFNEIIR